MNTSSPFASIQHLQEQLREGWMPDYPQQLAEKNAKIAEQAEKEQAEEIEKLTQSATKAWEEADRAKSKIAELTQGITDQCEEIARLTAELARLQRSYEVERNCSGERMTQILNLQREVEKWKREVEMANEYGALVVEHSKLQAQLAAVTAERDRLIQSLAALPDRWRKDQESAQSLITVNGCAYELEKALKPAPTAEEAERERFERAYLENYPAGKPDLQRSEDGEYRTPSVRCGFRMWQARASKEGQA